MRLLRYIIILLAIFSEENIIAQTLTPNPIRISGKFVNDSDKSVLSGVSVTLYTPDSLKQYQALTDNSGNFTFDNIPPSRYRIRATYIGYADFNIRLAVSATDINMGTLKMKWVSTNIKGVTVNGIVPVRQNEDTTEYSADAFKNPTRCYCRRFGK